MAPQIIRDELGDIADQLVQAMAAGDIAGVNNARAQFDDLVRDISSSVQAEA